MPCYGKEEGVFILSVFVSIYSTFAIFCCFDLNRFVLFLFDLN